MTNWTCQNQTSVCYDKHKRPISRITTASLTERYKKKRHIKQRGKMPLKNRFMRGRKGN